MLHPPKHQQIARKLRVDESSRTSLTGLSALLRHVMFIFALTGLQYQFSEGGTGFEYARDLHSGLSSAMARHSL